MILLSCSFTAIETISDSHFFKICDDQGNNIQEIPKSRLLWLLQDEKNRVSSDRLMRFRQGRREITVERIITDNIFYRDNALMPGDIVCLKSESKNDLCIIGKIASFKCSTGSSKGEKKFPFSFYIIGLNKDVLLGLSPCVIVDKKKKLKQTGFMYFDDTSYLFSVKSNFLNLSEKTISARNFSVLKQHVNSSTI